MIARNPHQLRKAGPERLESQFKLGGGFTDVAGEYEPIVGTAYDIRQCLSVDCMSQVQIAYCKQPHISDNSCNAGLIGKSRHQTARLSIAR
jgi:hypothetical protein